MEHWSGIIGAISGALVTGIVFVIRDFSSFAQNRKREKRELLMKKDILFRETESN